MVASAQSCFTSLAAGRESAARQQAAFRPLLDHRPNTTFAPLLPHRPKTRVRGFSGCPSGRLSRRGGARAINTPGSRACAYKTASGRHEWPNRDPIGEEGGNNLYMFVDNAPTDEMDDYGFGSTNDPSKPSPPKPSPPKPPPQFIPIPTPKPGSACDGWIKGRKTPGPCAEIDCVSCCAEMFSEHIMTHPFSLKNIGWLGWKDACLGTCQATDGQHGPDVPRPK